MSLDRNDAGYLKNMGDWSENVMFEMAKEDGYDLTDEHVKYILSAREMYEQDNTVPAIRVFAKAHGMDRKAKPLYDLFGSGPMKHISKYGGMPQPTGCV